MSDSLVGDVVRAAVVLAVATVAQQALNKALTGSGGASASPFPLKQSLPPRWSGYGESNRAGAYCLFEATHEGYSVDGLLMHDGRMEAWTEFSIHDDWGRFGEETHEAFGYQESNGFIRQRLLPEGDDGRYGYHADKVQILKTLGLPGGEAFDRVKNLLPAGTWTDDHLGKGTALLYLIAVPVKSDKFSATYPNGVPVLSRGVGKWQRVWDLRDEAQDPDDEDTHTWTANNALEVLDFLTTGQGGLGLDRDVWLDLPYFAAAADDCDDAIPLKGGGTEPRYRGHGGYFHTDNPSETLANMLKAMGGKLLPGPNGKLRLFAGKWREPTVTLTDDDIAAFPSLRRFGPRDEVVNELAVQYLGGGPEGWNLIDAPALRDEVSIAQRGGTFRDAFEIKWCRSRSQATRLAKAQLFRLNAALRGGLLLNLSGMRKAMGEPTVRLACPRAAARYDIPELTSLVVEVDDAKPDYPNLSCLLTVHATSADGWAWDPETEEPENNVTPGRVTRLALDAAVITDYEISDDGRAVLTVSAPDRPDLTWFLRYSDSDTGPWSDEAIYTDADDGASISLVTGVIPPTGLYFQATYQVGDGRRPDEWSAAFAVDAAAPESAPEPPTIIDYEGGEDGYSIGWLNPTSRSVGTRVWAVAAGGIFADAIDVSGLIAKSGDGTPDSHSDPSTALAFGDHDLYLTAENAGGLVSTPAGPVTVTVSPSAEAAAILAAFTTPATSARAKLINGLVTALKTAGVWTKLDVLHVMAAADSQAARVNWVSPGAYTLTATSSPTFTVDRGYTGNGTSAYLDVGVAVNALSHYALNSASLGGWGLDNAAGPYCLVGQSADNTILLTPRNGSDVVRAALNDATPCNIANTDSRGLFGANRSGSGARQFYRNGAAIGSDTIASTAVPSGNLTYLRNSLGTYSVHQIAVGFAGASLTSGEHLAAYNALYTYLHAIGAA